MHVIPYRARRRGALRFRITGATRVSGSLSYLIRALVKLLNRGSRCSLFRCASWCKPRIPMPFIARGRRFTTSDVHVSPLTPRRFCSHAKIRLQRFMRRLVTGVQSTLERYETCRRIVGRNLEVSCFSYDCSFVILRNTDITRLLRSR